MVRRDHGHGGDAMEGVGRHLRRQRAHFSGHRMQQFGVGDLSRGLPLQPIGGIVARGVGVELRIGPARQRAAQSLLRRLDPRLAVHGGMAAAEHDLGLPIERAQKLALPAVPDAWTHGADVGCGEGKQHLQAFLGLHDLSQRLGRPRVRKVASLSHVGHDQMLLDQPDHALRVSGRKTEPQAELPRDLDARVRVVGAAALGDVVQEGGEVELGAVLDLKNDLAHQRVILGEAPRLDRAERADRAQEMLVDRVVVVHGELHHADHAAEIGNEPAEHASLVHSPQRGLGRAARGEDLEEQAVCIRVRAQKRVYPLQRLGDKPRRARMDRQIRAIGDPEEADQVDRIALEGVGSDHVDATDVDLEILGVRDRARAPPQPSDEAVEHRRRLGLALFQRRANDRRQIADVFGDEEVVLHEAFDVGEPRPRRIPELTGDRPLHVETEALFGPAGEKVQPAAH